MAAYDVVVIGGSAMGSAAAYHLLRIDPQLSVAVVEKDPTYEYSSTLRCDGNLRVQFNVKENIQMSLYTLSILDEFADTMAIGDWRPDPTPSYHGNLFLADESGEAEARAGMEIQQSLGAEVEWLDIDEISSRWPAYETVGVVGGVHGPRDGYIDPSAILHAFRRNAIRLGAEYMQAEVVSVEAEKGAVTGVRLADGSELATSTVINCAGGWAKAIAATAGVDIPVDPVMRTVFVVDSPFDVEGMPSIFLPSGIYAIPEGRRSFEMAWSLPTDPIGFDFTFSRSDFEDVVWPGLIEVLPKFDRLNVTGGWCGIYAMNTFDANALIGEWPELPGYFMANGFSGHGFQHVPAMGRYLAELITGSPLSIDLSRLGPGRIQSGEPVREHAGRII